MRQYFKKVTWGLISKHRISIMAIAGIWVFLYHANQMENAFPGSVKILDIIFSRGNAGVDMFLFLSGIGLSYSCKNNPDIKTFYKKRIQRVLLPYLLIGGMFWAFVDILLKKDIMRFAADVTLLSFWKDGITRVWFVALILPLYAIFPLIWKFVYRDSSVTKGRILFLIAVAIGMNCVLGRFFPEWFENVEIALSRIPVFLVGIACVEKVWKNQPIKLTEIVIIGILCASKIWMNIYHVRGVPVRYWYAALGVAMCLLFAVLFDLCEMNDTLCKLKKRIAPIGIWSLEVYMVHVWVRRLIMKANVSYVIGGYDFNRYGIMDFVSLLLISALMTWIAVIIEKKWIFKK